MSGGSISKERTRSEWNYGASLKLERENWKSKVADERNEEVQETKQRKGSQNLKFRVVSDDAEKWSRSWNKDENWVFICQQAINWEEQTKLILS